MATNSGKQGGTRFRSANASSQPTGNFRAAVGSSQGRRFKTTVETSGSNRRSSAVRRGGNSSQTGSAYKHHYAGRGSHQNKKSHPAAIVAAVLVVIALVGGLAFFGVPAIVNLLNANSSNREEVEAGQDVTVTIPEGASGDDIASILYENYVIDSPQIYYATVSKMNADASLKPGKYLFTTHQDVEEVVQQLVDGPNLVSGRLTIPEGYTQKAIAERVEEQLGVSADDFLAQAKASNYKSEYSFLEGAPDDTLEGFLFPKTYDFDDDVDADTIIRAMLNQFQTEIATLDMSYVQERGLSIYEMVNLASIVEKEATQSTGAMVAAVFWNRLGNMGDPNYGYLQSDATTAYSVGHDPSSAEVHDENDPYSTYAYQGLPPTPICNPGLDALQSVCSPDMDYINGGYYYFYFYNDDDGVIQYIFSKTYEEHLKATEEH